MNHAYIESKPEPDTATSSSAAPDAAKTASGQAMIDFFSGIEEEQQTMFNPQTNRCVALQIILYVSLSSTLVVQRLIISSNKLPPIRFLSDKRCMGNRSLPPKFKSNQRGLCPRNRLASTPSASSHRSSRLRAHFNHSRLGSLFHRRLVRIRSGKAC